MQDRYTLRRQLEIIRRIGEAPEPIPQIDDETVKQFMDRLDTAGRVWVREQWGDEVRACLQDVQGTTAIFDVWRFDSNMPNFDTYVQVDYERDAEGSFDFGAWSEVVRVISWTPAMPDERQLAPAGASGESDRMGEAAAPVIRALESLLRRQDQGFADAAEKWIGDGALVDKYLEEARIRRCGCEVGPIEEHENIRWRVGDVDSLRIACRRLGERGTVPVVLQPAVEATAARLGCTPRVISQLIRQK